MAYSLIVDIGNSQIEFGLFEKEQLIAKDRFETSKLNDECDSKKLKGLLDKFNISYGDVEDGMIFSVVPHLTRLVQILIKGEIGISLRLFNPQDFLKNVKCNIDDPNEIGQDLLADIFGAIHYYGVPVIVSDLGTVTKNIIIDKDEVFQGVSFFPGARANANALSDKTAQLPTIKNITKPELFFGKNTIDAMRSGVYYCHVAAIKRFMYRAEEYFEYPFKKVVTGGFSNTFKQDFGKDKYIVDPDLVLKGMNLIFINQKR